ncbi:MAG: hypothetical protein MHM6MM_001733 [Cercozoa sp. M6MM]
MSDDETYLLVVTQLARFFESLLCTFLLERNVLPAHMFERTRFGDCSTMQAKNKLLKETMEKHIRHLLAQLTQKDRVPRVEFFSGCAEQDVVSVHTQQILDIDSETAVRFFASQCMTVQFNTFDRSALEECNVPLLQQHLEETLAKATANMHLLPCLQTLHPSNTFDVYVFIPNDENYNSVPQQHQEEFQCKWEPVFLAETRFEGLHMSAFLHVGPSLDQPPATESDAAMSQQPSPIGAT